MTYQDTLEMIEVHETIEVHDIPEMIGAHVQVEMIQDLEDQVMINFWKNSKVSFLMVQKNSMQL